MFSQLISEFWIIPGGSNSVDARDHQKFVPSLSIKSQKCFIRSLKILQVEYQIFFEKKYVYSVSTTWLQTFSLQIVNKDIFLICVGTFH